MVLSQQPESYFHTDISVSGHKRVSKAEQKRQGQQQNNLSRKKLHIGNISTSMEVLAITHNQTTVIAVKNRITYKNYRTDSFHLRRVIWNLPCPVLSPNDRGTPSVHIGGQSESEFPCTKRSLKIPYSLILHAFCVQWCVIISVKAKRSKSYRESTRTTTSTEVHASTLSQSNFVNKVSERVDSNFWRLRYVPRFTVVGCSLVVNFDLARLW